MIKLKFFSSSYASIATKTVLNLSLASKIGIKNFLKYVLEMTKNVFKMTMWHRRVVKIRMAS
jgi:hypothetical protein